MLERDYQSELKKKISEMFPGCEILKNDPRLKQGFPDLLILYKDRWAALEVKKSAKASKRPNQEYRVKKLSKMSFASFIFLENETEVLDELQRTFKV